MLEIGLLYLTVNAVAVDYSLSLTRSEKYKMILEMGDKGYKIDSTKVTKKEFEQNQKEKILNLITMLIPGLNILKTKNDIEKFKINVKETIENNDILIKMTQQEQEIYSHLETEEVKLYYLSMLCLNNINYQQNNDKKIVKTYGRN